MSRYTYCSKCDKDVEAVEVTVGTRGGSASLRCSECGNVLANMPEGEPGAAKTKLERVVIAGYNNIQSDLLIGALVRNKYAEQVESCANGEEFLSKITKLLHQKEPAKLVIIEVNMAIMNGINAALCMRSIEKGLTNHKMPILFFTQKAIDDMFTRAIKFLTPAKYVPLPQNVDPETFRSRADQVAELLKKETW